MVHALNTALILYQLLRAFPCISQLPLWAREIVGVPTKQAANHKSFLVGGSARKGCW